MVVFFVPDSSYCISGSGGTRNLAFCASSSSLTVFSELYIAAFRRAMSSYSNFAYWFRAAWCFLKLLKAILLEVFLGYLVA